MREQYHNHKCMNCGDVSVVRIPQKFECYPTRDQIKLRKLCEFVEFVSRQDCDVHEMILFNARNILKEIGEE